MMVMVDYDDDEPSCPQTGVKWKGQEGQTQRVGAVSPSLIVKRIIIIVNIIIIVLDREDDRYHCHLWTCSRFIYLVRAHSTFGIWGRAVTLIMIKME